MSDYVTHLRGMAEVLEEKYGYWGEHPDFHPEAWQQDVAEENTRHGYWVWVAIRIEAEE